MDEPTTGVDAISRRFIWNMIKKIKRKNNKSIILSTINPEECQMLCSNMYQLIEGVLKERPVSEAQNTTILLTFRLKHNQDLDKMSDGNLKKKFFETNDDQYQVLNRFKFESRRKVTDIIKEHII